MSRSVMIVVAILAQVASPAPVPGDPELRQVVADYVGLYRHDALPRWRELFLPGFTAAHTLPDGTVKVRTLDQFYASQEKYLGSGRAITESLEDVRVERRGKLASVSADFVLTEDRRPSRGRLMLTLIAAQGRWKIQSLAFSYDGE